MVLFDSTGICWFVETTRLACESIFYSKYVGAHLADAWNKVSDAHVVSNALPLRDDLRYNIEPFFWSSSLNWIPSRFQEEIQPEIGDRP